MMGTLALGYISMSGMNTPWSQPLFKSDFRLIPSPLRCSLTLFLTSALLRMGYVRLQVCGGKPQQSQQCGGLSQSIIVQSFYSQCAEKRIIALGLGNLFSMSWNCLYIRACSSLWMSGIGPPPCVTNTEAMRTMRGSSNENNMAEVRMVCILKVFFSDVASLNWFFFDFFLFFLMIFSPIYVAVLAFFQVDGFICKL